MQSSAMSPRLIAAHGIAERALRIAASGRLGAAAVCRLILGLGVAAGPAAAADLASAAGALQALRKTWCSAEDGAPSVFAWRGEAYARLPGEPDRRLFPIAGLSVRVCAGLSDPVRGEGFRLVGREATFALDPVTGAPAMEVANPWTGEVAPAPRWVLDPVKGDVWARGADGAPLAWRGVSAGGRFSLSLTAPADASGRRTAEMFSFMGDDADLRDDTVAAAPVHLAWFRLSPLPKWAAPPGRSDGLLYMHAAGGRLMRFEDLPESVRDYVLLRAPELRAPPPLDDPRPADTRLEEAAP